MFEQQDLAKVVMEATGGRGVDVVVDTTGDPDGSIAAQAVALSAKGAWLSLNGLGEHRCRWARSRSVISPCGHRAGTAIAAVQTALDIVASGRWPIDKLCSHDFSLDQVHEAILATAGRGIEGAIHVTVSPHKHAGQG